MTKFAALLIVAAALAGSAQAQAPKPQSMVDASKELPTAKPAAVIDLGKEFGALKGYAFQQTVNTVPPGWGRAEHSHKGAPEIVHIVSGTLTDQRIGGPKVTYGPGSTFTNADGISHMWANFGTEPVVMINTSVRVAAP